MRIALAAGELSGDRLGAALMQAIRQRHPNVTFEGVAGPQMREAGCKALLHAEQLAVMGLVEVAGQLPRLLSLRRRLRRALLDNPPQVFVGIDAPDFNLGLERHLKRRGISTVHWVSPSVWAWRGYRARRINRSVDVMLTLFPFETEFYARHDIPAVCTGHPLADDIGAPVTAEQGRAVLNLDPQTRCVALLPGSRSTEVKRLLPAFLGAAALLRGALPDLQFVLPVASPCLLPVIRQALQQSGHSELPVTLLDSSARQAMQAADAVLLASGTATLECLLLERPMVVAYRMHPLSFYLVRRLLQVPHVSLPNNLLGTAQVPEFLQRDANPQQLADAILELLENPATAARQIAPFHTVHAQLRQNAADRAAQIVLQRSMR